MNFPFGTVFAFFSPVASFRTQSLMLYFIGKSVKIASRSGNANNKLIKIPCNGKIPSYNTNKQCCTMRNKFRSKCAFLNRRLYVENVPLILTATKCLRCLVKKCCSCWCVYNYQHHFPAQISPISIRMLECLLVSLEHILRVELRFMYNYMTTNSISICQYLNVCIEHLDELYS